MTTAARRLRTDRSPERHRRRAWRAPQRWITLPFWNNFFLMVILIWIQPALPWSSFGGAARHSEEDDRGGRHRRRQWLAIFFKIMGAAIWGTIAVVWTTITILVLNGFRYRARDDERAMAEPGACQPQCSTGCSAAAATSAGAAAIAVVIMILVVPIMIWNIRNATQGIPGGTEMNPSRRSPLTWAVHLSVLLLVLLWTLPTAGL